MDITRLIEDDHQEQRRLFAVIDDIPDSEVGAQTAVWGRLRALLDAHAEAEERFFYPELLKIGKGAADSDSAKAETKDAIRDHNAIRDAGTAVEKCNVGSSDWRAAVAEANKANSDHMAEEERQGLADFRQHGSLELRQSLGIKFAEFQSNHLIGVKPVDKDPDQYIQENE
jgi:hypothetical protein